MQIKMTRDSTLHLSEWLRSKTKVRDHTGEDVEQGEHFSVAGGNTHLYSHFRNQYGSFSENWESIYLKTQLYHISKGCSMLPQGHLLSHVHLVLFIIARNWKQPRYPSTKEWIKKRWHIFTKEYCSTVKKR